MPRRLRGQPANRLRQSLQLCLYSCDEFANCRHPCAHLMNRDMPSAVNSAAPLWISVRLMHNQVPPLHQLIKICKPRIHCIDLNPDAS